MTADEAKALSHHELGRLCADLSLPSETMLAVEGENQRRVLALSTDAPAFAQFAEEFFRGFDG
jgi:hypothetical protein